jgi:hypothetical protein
MAGTIPDHYGLRDPCFLCKQSFQGGKEFASTVFTLHCGHAMHMKCIFAYWDQEGKYLHRCPKCRFAATLNFQTLGISPVYQEHDPFVHNIWGYGRAAQVWFKAEARIPQALDLYDVPPENEMSKYWQAENIGLIIAEENPAWWQPVVFLPGEQATLNVSRRGWTAVVMLPGNVQVLAHDFRHYNQLTPRRRNDVQRYIYSDSMNHVARTLISRLRDIFDNSPDLNRRREYDLDIITRRRVLHGSRAYRMPQAEAARLRALRRKRDRERRAAVARKGVAGLYEAV